MNRYDIALGKAPLSNVTDDKGRITEYRVGNSGHSVCNSCGKDMPRCWDTVCFKCRKTYCYKCSITIKGFWFCKNCSKAGYEDWMNLPVLLEGLQHE